MTSPADLLRRDAETYDRKAADYAPDATNRFENFSTSAGFTQMVTGKQLSEVDSCLILIGTKLSRLQTLGIRREAANESILDTLSDLRVYLAILEAMLRERAELPN